MKRLMTIIAFLVLTGTSQVEAQTTGSDEWQFQLSPLYPWATNLDGTMQLGGGPPGESENLETAFTVHFEASKGRWGLLADAMYLNLKGDQSISGPGETAEVRIKNLILESAGGYRVGTRFWIIAGLRYFKIDPTVSFVTPMEFRQLERISDRRGVSLSAVIHTMVVRSLENDAAIPPENDHKIQQRSDT